MTSVILGKKRKVFSFQTRAVMIGLDITYLISIHWFIQLFTYLRVYKFTSSEL